MFVPTMPGKKLRRKIVGTRNPSRLINRDDLHLNTNKDTRRDAGKARKLMQNVLDWNIIQRFLTNCG